MDCMKENRQEKMAGRANITIKTVAKELGLSFSTVSKALNDNPMIKDSTKQLVRAKCSELGYTPNAMARKLRQNANKNIAVIFNDLQNPILTKIFDDIAIQMQPDYSIVICDSQFDSKMEKAHIQTTLENRSDIILLEPTVIDDPNLKLLQHSCDRLILFGAPNNEICCNGIRIDYELGGYLSTLEMLENKHTDNAVFCVSRNFPSAAAFLNGIRKAYSEFGLTFNEERIFDVDSTEKAAFRQASALMQDKDAMPTGYITFCDVYAAGIYKAAARNDIRIPDDISVMGHDNYPLSDLVYPALTTINIPSDRIAESCVRLIKNILNGAESTICYSFEPTLIRRNSVSMNKRTKEGIQI